jgi:protein CWC15
MTTAHRPTFNAAQGKGVQRGPALHTRLLPAHTTLKFRQAGQGGDADASPRDLRAELLRAEAAAKARKEGKTITEDEDPSSAKRGIEQAQDEDEEEDPEVKRRRLILEQAAEEDADSAGESEEESSDEDEEDEEAELMRELEKIKRERAEARAKEVWMPPRL